MLSIVKRIAKSLPVAFTKNQKYDRLTRAIIQKVCTVNSNTIDIGCHKGEVLDIILSAAPKGRHYGFEPLPHLYKGLQEKYPQTNVKLYDIALSNQSGEASFNYVITNPSYSGLIKRKYDKPNEKDTTITVRTERLDAVIPEDEAIDLIKIDVEGGELLVLEGAINVLKKDKPVVIFEHGLGASEFYGAGPEKVFSLFETCGMFIYLLDDFLQGRSFLSKEAFVRQFENRLNYYFVAAK